MKKKEKQTSMYHTHCLMHSGHLKSKNVVGFNQVGNVLHKLFSCLVPSEGRKFQSESASSRTAGRNQGSLQLSPASDCTGSHFVSKRFDLFLKYICRFVLIRYTYA